MSITSKNGISKDDFAHFTIIKVTTFYAYLNFVTSMQIHHEKLVRINVEMKKGQHYKKHAFGTTLIVKKSHIDPLYLDERSEAKLNQDDMWF